MAQNLSLTERLAELAPGTSPDVLAHLERRGFADFHQVHDNSYIIEQARDAARIVAAEREAAEALARHEATESEKACALLAARNFDLSKIYGEKKLHLYNWALREVAAQQDAPHHERSPMQGRKPAACPPVVTSQQIPAQGDGPLDPLKKLRAASSILTGVSLGIVREHSNLAARLTTVQDSEFQRIGKIRLEALRRQALIHGIEL